MPVFRLFRSLPDAVGKKMGLAAGSEVIITFKSKLEH